MPIRRRRGVRVPFRKRRVMRRRVFRPRRGLRNVRRPYYYKQMLKAASLSFPAGAAPPTPGIGYSFNIASLPNVATFAALYDEYRIAAVKVRFVSLSSQTVPGNVCGVMYHALDYDDAAVPTIGSITSLQTCKATPSNRSFVRYFKPKVQTATFVGAGSAVTGSPHRGWINFTSTGQTVLHYGLKVFMDYPSLTTNSQDYSIIVTYYLAFRNVV